MSEQTNFEVSLLLDKAGFRVPADGMYVQVLAGEKAGTWKWIEGHETAPANEHCILSYRADTLEEWLLSLDVKEVAEMMGVRTLAENGDRACLRIEQIRIDFKGTLAYAVQLHRPIEMGAHGPVLVDALGRLVCEVMKVLA